MKEVTIRVILPIGNPVDIAFQLKGDDTAELLVERLKSYDWLEASNGTHIQMKNVVALQIVK